MVLAPLADNAVLIDLGNVIRRDVNAHVICMCEAIQQQPFPGFIEVVPAYSSAAVFFDPRTILLHSAGEESAFEKVVSYLTPIAHAIKPQATWAGRHMHIPVCYDPAFGPDLPNMCASLNLMIEDIIRLHTSKEYHIYMMGFLPGFPYMGDVEETLFMPRKTNPVPVRAGSVGVAGVQTGIYPMDSPGGWNIIGRTPLRLFDPNIEHPVLFRPGDTVTFYPISPDEFEHTAQRSVG